MNRLISGLLLIAAAITTSCREKDVYPSGVCTVSVADSSFQHPKSAAFKTLMTEYTKKGLPGMAILIKDPSGTWVGVDGKADIEKNIDMQPCHIGKTASLTKTFFATLALKLQEEGALDLDDKISKHIPEEIISKIENADHVTLRMLLNHTSGIYDHTLDSDFYLAVLNNPAKNWTQKELLQYVYGKSAAFTAGSKTGYSNTNTLLASLVVDNATGKQHGQLLREKIINPLGLTNTYYHWYDKLPENQITQGYFDLYNNGNIINISNLNTGNGNGYNGIYSTVHDLERFIDALLIKKIVLTEASLSQMLEFHPHEESGRRLGLGLVKDFINRPNPNEYAFGHRGRDLGYTAELFWFPEKNVSFSLLLNYGNDANSHLRPVYFEFREKLVDLMMQ